MQATWLNCVGGHQVVKAYHVGDSPFAVHRNLDFSSEWQVTHVPSGRTLVRYFKSRQGAIDFAADLDEMELDFESVSYDERGSDLYNQCRDAVAYLKVVHQESFL